MGASDLGSKRRFAKLVTQYVYLASTGSFNFGFSLAALNTSKQWISYDFKWCPSEDGKTGNLDCSLNTSYSSVINVGVFLGATAGCLMGGKLTEFGRRTSTLIMHGMFILGAVLSATAEGFLSLLMARIVMGLGVGFSTVCVPMLISEMSPKQSRGYYGVFHQLFITVGIMTATILGLPLGIIPANKSDFITLTAFQSIWWRVMLGLPLLVCIPALFLLLTVYKTDTPHFLIESKKKEEAEALLKQIYNKPDVSPELQEICSSVANAREMQSQSLSVWRALKNSVYRPVILTGCVLSIVQQLTGINVLMVNSNLLYSASGLGEYNTHLSVGMCTLNVLMTFPAIWFVDRLGRRTLMLIGTAGQALALAPAMIANLVDYNSSYTKYISVASTFVYVVFFAVAYGPILWVYLHEIFPVEIKQGASSLASSLNWLTTIAMVLPSEFLLADSSTTIFSLFTGMCAMGFALVFFLMKETKGLSIDDSPYLKNKQRSLPAPSKQLTANDSPVAVNNGNSRGDVTSATHDITAGLEDISVMQSRI